MEMVDPIVFRLTIFALAIFVGYFVVWSVTPALHTPLMAVTNAISSVIVVGALIAAAVPAHGPASAAAVPSAQDGMVSTANPAPMRQTILTSSAASQPAAVSTAAPEEDSDVAATRHAWTSKLLGFLGLILASVNIFGGFLVTQRMLAMYKKKGAK
jgi:NAD(P) transhydrogenase subunit alpha